jgi:hypothetical protein
VRIRYGLEFVPLFYTAELCLPAGGLPVGSRVSVLQPCQESHIDSWVDLDCYFCGTYVDMFAVRLRDITHTYKEYHE